MSNKTIKSRKISKEKRTENAIQFVVVQCNLGQ